MIKEMISELLRSGIGRVSLLMFIVLGGMALYVVFAFQEDLGKTIWNNPEYWADNPKSAPPSWLAWFDQEKKQHKLFISSRPQAEFSASGKNYIYSFNVKTASAGPPAFLSLSLSDIIFYDLAPIIEVYLAGRGEGKDVLLYRHIAASRRSDENLPAVRYKDVPYRVNLTAAKENEAKVRYFLTELSIAHSHNYRIKVVARLNNRQDDIGEVKVVIGGDAYGLLGTDNMGRDVFTGVLAGLPWALLVGLPSALLATLLGAMIGGISGYFGGRRDTCIQLVIDIISLLPILPLLIYLTFVFGPNILFVVIILALTGWIGLARKLRPWVFQIRESGFVTYLRAMGFSPFRIITRHILPQTLPFILMYCAFFVPGAILAEAGLSILGLGDPSLATWGQMLNQGLNTGAVYLGYWWWILPPGIAIVATSMSLFLLFRSLEKAAEPRLRKE